MAEISNLLLTAGITGTVVGMAIVAIAVVSMIVSRADPTERTRALGFGYVGLSVATASGALMMMSRLGDRLPIIAGLPPIAFLLLVAVILRRAASRKFQRYQSEKRE